MKKVFLISLCLSFFYINCFAQQNVDYTNQFFAAKTTQGRCFVFIYSDNCTFVNIVGNRATEPVKILINMEGIDDVFIAGDKYFIKRRQSLYYYELSALTDINNKDRRIGDIRGALIGEISNISELCLNNDLLIYTKNRDKNVYSFSPSTRREATIDKITYNPGARNIVQYFDLLDTRLKKYESEKNTITPIINNYTQIGGDRDRRGIEARLNSIALNLNKHNVNDVYSEVKTFLDQNYRNINNDIVSINNFIELSHFISKEKKDEAVNLVSRICMPQVTLNDVLIKQYFEADSKIKTNEDEINSLFTASNSRWDNEQKRRSFNNLAAAITNQNYNSTWESNHAEINRVLTGTSFDKNEDFIRYVIMYDAYIQMKNNRAKYRQFDANIVSNIISDYESQARNLQKKIIEISTQQYNRISNLIATTKTQKTDAYARIIRYIESNYINDEIYKKVIINPIIDIEYNSDFINYCIVTESSRRIHGFSSASNNTISIGDFANIRNNADESARFIRPSGYPMVNICEKGIFILDSRNQISGYDISKTNILKKMITPRNIDSGIFYMIRDSKEQYIVTNDGNLLQLTIEDTEIRDTQVRIGSDNVKISGNDTVLVTDGMVYIFQNGTVRSNARDNTIRVRACNSSDPMDIYTFSFNNRGFSIQ